MIYHYIIPLYFSTITSYMAGCICSLKSSWGSFHIWRSILSSISRKAAAMTKNTEITKLKNSCHKNIGQENPALIGSWFQPIRWRYYLFCCRVRLPLTGSQFSPAGFLSGPWKAHPPLTARVAVSIAKTSQGRRSRQGKIWHRLLRLRKVGLCHLTSGPYVNWP